MGLWQIPEKILLPAEPGCVSTFEFNGHLPNGDQVMAYVGPYHHYPFPNQRPIVRSHTAVLFRFDADGTLRSCDFATSRHSEAEPDRSYREACTLLGQLVEKAKTEGWVSADILVRPFFVVVDGLRTGLIYSTEDEDVDDEFDECSPEEMRLVPFDKIFRRPWTDGQYDT